MILSLSNQAVLFLTTVAVGFFIGAVYDVFRIIRLVFKHPNFVVQLEDGLYWICVILVMFLFMLHENYGEIRFFSICGAFLGMLFYFLTLSRLIMKISDAIIRIVKYIICLFLQIIFTPFRLLYLLLKKPVEKTGRFIRGKTNSLLQNFRVYAKIRKRRTARQIRVILSDGKKGKHKKQ